MYRLKRAWTWILTFCLTLCLLSPMSTQASDYQEITIQVFNGNADKEYSALYLADELYFSAEDFQTITRYRFTETENSLSYQRGEKRIVVNKTTGEYHIFGPGMKGTVQVVVHNGTIYLPASELLPWMNVHCAVEDGVLQVIPDNASIWDALDGLTYEDYAFNLYQEFGDSTSSVVGLSAMTVFDTVINLRFDRLIPVDISTDGGFGMTTLYDYECYINTLTYLLKDEKTFGERLEGDLGKYGKWNSYLDDILEKTGIDEKKIQLAIDDYYRICGDTETGELLYDGTQTWLYVREFFRDYDKVAKYMDVFLVLKLCEVVMETDYEYKEYIQWLSGRETGNAVFDKALAETSRLLNENEGIILAYYLNLFSKVAEEIPDTVVNAIANNTMNDTVINLCNSYKSGFFGSLNQYMSIAKIIYSTIIPVTKGYEAIAKVNVTETIQDYCWQLAAKLEQGEMTQENIARVRQSYLTALRTSRMAFEGKQEIMDLKLFGVITVLDGEGLLDGFLKRLDEKVLELTASVDATENDSVEGKTEYTEELKQMFRELMESSNRDPQTGDNQVVLLAYAKMLQNGVWLRLDNGDQIPASHYSLLDMNADGCSEIIVFAVDNYVPTFEIYTYTDGDVLRIADSLDTCDVSKWYNAGTYVYICDGRYVFAGADKATAAYQAASFALLKYDGQSVNSEKSNMYNVQTGHDVCKLVECGEIVGGIEIGSDADTLSSRDEPTETEPTETEPSTPRSGYSVEMLLEGGMDLLLAVCDDFQYSEGYDDYGVGHLDGEEFTVAFDPQTGVIERITIWKMGGSLEITDGVYSDMSYQELRNAWKGTSGWTDIQYDFMYGGSNPETDVHDAYVEFAWGESGSGSSDWSSWSWDRQSVGANQEEEVRTVWGYYYYPCAECGAHMHGYNDPCWTWAGGCGAAKIPHDWHEVWSTVSWEDANLRDWHGTGKFYTYIDGELVFKWTEHGSARQQYRYRTVDSSIAAYQVTLNFCTPIAETGNIPVVQLITIERMRTGRSGGELADGEYYAALSSWSDTQMTVELLDFQGWNEEYMYRMYEETGEYITLDIAGSSVWLEWAWMSEESDIWCASIDAALDTKIWGGNTTVRENCTMTIKFNVANGSVAEIVILYAS